MCSPVICKTYCCSSLFLLIFLRQCNKLMQREKRNYFIQLPILCLIYTILQYITLTHQAASRKPLFLLRLQVIPDLIIWARLVLLVEASSRKILAW